MSIVDDLITAKDTLLAAEEAVNTALSEFETLHLSARTARANFVTVKEDLTNEIMALNSGMSAGQKTAALATIQSRRNARAIEATTVDDIETTKQSKRDEIRTLQEALSTAQTDYDAILANL